MLNQQGKDLLLAGSTMVGAGTTAVMGGTKLDVAAGANIAKNGTEFNYLDHRKLGPNGKPSLLRLSEQEQYDAAVAACGPADKAACDRRDELAATSKKRDYALSDACFGPTANRDLCDDTARRATTMGNVVTTLPNGITFANSPTPSSLNTNLIGPTTSPANSSFNQEVSQNLSTSLVAIAPASSPGLLAGTFVAGMQLEANVENGNLGAAGLNVVEIGLNVLGTKIYVAPATIATLPKGSTAAAGEAAGSGEGAFTGVQKGSYIPPESKPLPTQMSADTCVIANCKTVTGSDYSEGTIGYFLNSSNGTKLKNVPDGLQGMGFKGSATYQTGATVSDVAAATKNGGEVLVNIKVPDPTAPGGVSYHNVIVDSVASDGTVSIRDPWPIGKGSAYTIPSSALKNQMTGSIVIVKR